LVFPTLVDGVRRVAIKIIDFGCAKQIDPKTKLVVPSEDDQRRTRFLWTHPDIFGTNPFDPKRADGNLILIDIFNFM
jgi:hypothetical protein